MAHSHQLGLVPICRRWHIPLSASVGACPHYLHPIPVTEGASLFPGTHPHYHGPIPVTMGSPPCPLPRACPRHCWHTPVTAGMSLSPLACPRPHSSALVPVTVGSARSHSLSPVPFLIPAGWFPFPGPILSRCGPVAVPRAPSRLPVSAAGLCRCRCPRSGSGGAGAGCGGGGGSCP